jgi:S-adenosylmethionine-diacylglycerol 3-amino-3-carboxypropyl transferase
MSSDENMGMGSGFSSWLFHQIHSRNLVYNQCWEDPAVDNEVLGIGPEDHIVMITSAGCNALDYLIRDPASIHCVDINPNQNALLELKVAAIQALRYEQFFDMFGNGRIRGHRRIYSGQLRHRLTGSAQQIWDARIDYFDPDGTGLYFHGTAGLLARTLSFYFNNCLGMRKDLQRFQLIHDLGEQSEFYRTRIAPRLWSPAVRFLMRQPSVLSLAGVPMEQIAQIQQDGHAEVSSFIEERLETTLTTIPMRYNYFWRVYINGHYDPDCCPNYLRREFFYYLRNRVSRINIQTSSLDRFLQSAQRRFSVFVLLDHMDWLSNQPRLLEQEWRSIMDHAEPGARIIYRSGSVACDYIPDSARRRLHFQSDRTKELHSRDRVGTYASLHFATVIA